MGFEDSSMRERIIKLIHREGISQREFAKVLDKTIIEAFKKL